MFFGRPHIGERWGRVIGQPQKYCVPTLSIQADGLDIEAVASDQTATETVFDGAEKLAAAVAKLEALEASMAAEASEVPAQELVESAA